MLRYVLCMIYVYTYIAICIMIVCMYINILKSALLPDVQVGSQGERIAFAYAFTPCRGCPTGGMMSA